MMRRYLQENIGKYIAAVMTMKGLDEEVDASWLVKEILLPFFWQKMWRIGLMPVNIQSADDDEGEHLVTSSIHVLTYAVEETILHLQIGIALDFYRPSSRTFSN